MRTSSEVGTNEKRRKDVQSTEPNKPDQEKLVAARDTTYSTVKSATRLVSKPNHIPPRQQAERARHGLEDGDERGETMRAMTTPCMRTAAADELGRSAFE